MWTKSFWATCLLFLQLFDNICCVCSCLTFMWTTSTRRCWASCLLCVQLFDSHVNSAMLGYLLVVSAAVWHSCKQHPQGLVGLAVCCVCSFLTVAWTVPCWASCLLCVQLFDNDVNSAMLGYRFVVSAVVWQSCEQCLVGVPACCVCSCLTFM